MSRPPVTASRAAASDQWMPAAGPLPRRRAWRAGERVACPPATARTAAMADAMGDGSRLRPSFRVHRTGRPASSGPSWSVRTSPPPRLALRARSAERFTANPGLEPFGAAAQETTARRNRRHNRSAAGRAATGFRAPAQLAGGMEIPGSRGGVPGDAFVKAADAVGAIGVGLVIRHVIYRHTPDNLGRGGIGDFHDL